LGILRSQYPQQEHPAGVLQGGMQVFGWCEGRGLFDLAKVKPLHVAAYIEDLQRTHSKPTVKQHLAALRMLFDWLVVGHVMDVNPAHSVRGPKHVVKKGKTPVLAADEARILLDSIDTSTVMGLRDRALIAVMAYTFARVSAATAMKVEDYFVQGRRSWVRLYEKGGKQHEVPAHHNLDEYRRHILRLRACRATRKVCCSARWLGRLAGSPPSP
jgi:integrase/recombinase XerD